MEKSIAETENGEATMLIKATFGRKSPYRYSKEELLEIKESPFSKHRPGYLLDKYDSDGVWDPEKWHASLYSSSGHCSPVEGSAKKDTDSDRTSLKRRIPDPRERVKEDDLDVMLIPQRRSFGGGCHVTAVSSSRQAGSPSESKENESLQRVGGRRIGSGRIISARAFDREIRGTDKDFRELRETRERDKDKRFRRDFPEGRRVFGERRRNDSYTEEEPEWFVAGPTSQSETIELTGFDDKILEEDQKRHKRSRRQPFREELQCNGSEVVEEEVDISHDAAADQEVPREELLPGTAPGDFDFNEFFNLDKSVPGLASMIEDVLNDGSVSSSRFSRWFNNSRSGSRSSSLRSTPHEELERLAGLEQSIPSPSPHQTNYFAPIPMKEEEGPGEGKVDILEMLQKAKVDLKPLLSTMTANKERLRESTNSGVVLSVEEVEAELKSLKVEPERKIATPFMAEQLEERFTAVTNAKPSWKRDTDMSAFNKLVSSMKASGTLPTQPKSNRNLESHVILPTPEVPLQHPPPKNILQEILGPQIARPASSDVLSNLLRSSDPNATLHGQRGPSPPLHLFPRRAPSADYLRPRIQSPVGFAPGPPQLIGDPYHPLPSATSPVLRQGVNNLELQQAVLDGFPFPHELALQAGNLYQPGFGKLQLDKGRDGYRNWQPRMSRSPGAGHRVNTASPVPSATVTSMLSPSFTPTSVIRKMYESKEKSKEEPVSGKSTVSHGKEDGQRSHDDTAPSPRSQGENADRGTSPAMVGKSCTAPRSACSTPLTNVGRFTAEQDLRPRSAGRKTPTMESPILRAPFLRPVCQVPLVSHVPVVRPVHHQLHPGMVQRLLPPPHLQPLLQAGVIPPGIDLSHIQGISPSLLGQPLYPLPLARHPLLNTRSGASLHLAMMQQQLQRPVMATGGSQNLHQSVSHRTVQTQQRQSPRSGSPVGLAKWFGSDVLQQPLPSMPAKVISVDELEFRQ